MADMEPVRLDRDPLADLDPEAELRLEQDSRAQIAAQISVDDAARTVVDGKSDPGPHKDLPSDLPAQAGGGEVRPALGADRDQGVGRRRPDDLQTLYAFAAEAGRERDTAFIAALVERRIDVVGVEAAEQLAGARGRGGQDGGRGREKEREAIHRRQNLSARAEFRKRKGMGLSLDARLPGPDRVAGRDQHEDVERQDCRG